MLMTLCSGLIERSVKGGLIVVGALNLGGSVEMIANPVAVAELAVEKGAATLLMPISARKQLFELPDALATKISIEFYADSKDAFLKALVEITQGLGMSKLYLNGFRIRFSSDEFTGYVRAMADNKELKPLGTN